MSALGEGAIPSEPGPPPVKPPPYAWPDGWSRGHAACKERSATSCFSRGWPRLVPAGSGRDRTTPSDVGPQKDVEADIQPSTYRHVRKGGVIGNFPRSTGPVVPAQQFWRSITRNFRNPAAMTAKSESRSSSRRPVNRSAIRRSITGPARARSRRLSELCKRSQRLQTSPKRSRSSSSSFASRASNAQSSSSVADQTNRGTHKEGGLRFQCGDPVLIGVLKERPPLPSPPRLAREPFAVASKSELVGSTGSLVGHPGLARVTLSPFINANGGWLTKTRLGCHCGAENTLKPGDVIQCRECGYRILYKKRTRRVVQYEAR
ncbi:hypothetical protein C4D60_Mb11t01580 [Musa balbisiana]|uniref:Uncharacterized protein n=1 Tax=Musa balbisiana TaxID=52838 RepID=A0A4S8J3F9_MUSBA|nr:hypothetical protein C4D60_Mb11t01580 [Musa balbisiana]